MARIPEQEVERLKREVSKQKIFGEKNQRSYRPKLKAQKTDNRSKPKSIEFQPFRSVPDEDFTNWKFQFRLAISKKHQPKWTEPITTLMGNLKKCSYHRSYTLWKKDLNGLNFNSQSLREWICQDGEKKVVYWCMPLFLPFIFFLSLVFLCVFFFSILSFLSTFPLVPFTVHTTPFLYHLPLWNLPFLPFNCFWLLMGILPRLPTSLPAT